MQQLVLPSGTVTFLFTDIEGSTQLLHELGPEAYAAALAEHRRVIREACGRRGGVEVDTQGDAFFVAFASAPGALAAAADLRDGLTGGPIKVRVGVHTGRPLLIDDGYVGVDVHRAARIAAAAHGGQVLLSRTTRELLDDGFVVRDLGEHRFKDLSAAERVFQLGEAEFAPIRSLFRTNLPVPATPFLGREQELASVVSLLESPTARLVTLTGPGGTGKTRLALQAAAEMSDRFPDGTWWVPLAALRDPSLLLATVAEAIGVETGSDPLAAIATALSGKHPLLVLDNVEHLLPRAAADVAALVAAVPSLQGLATSRERLGVAAEIVHSVAPMDLDDGVALFVARALVVGAEVGEDQAIQRVCERLDGLPLAIELAAARTRMFLPSQLLDRLEGALDLEAGVDADPRQRTLRATIGWSHELLTDAEKQLFARLAVFGGGSTVEAAEAVCDATVDGLLSLLDKSLVRRLSSEHEPRFWMLETIRGFAEDQLERSGEYQAMRDRHADFFAARARDAAPHMYGGRQTRDRIAQLDVEQSNIRAALEHMHMTRGPAPLAAFVVDLGRYWYVTSRNLEGLRWFRVADGPLAPELSVKVRAGHALFEAQEGDLDVAGELAGTSVRLWRTLPDTTGISDPLATLGILAMLGGDLDAALGYFDDALEHARANGDQYWETASLLNTAEPLYMLGRTAEALERLDEAHASAERGSLDELRLLAANNKGSTLLHTGEFERALPILVEGTVEALRDGYARIALFPLVALARLAVERERWLDAAKLLGYARPLLASAELDAVMERGLENEAREAFTAALQPVELEEALRCGAGLTRDELITLVESLQS